MQPRCVPSVLGLAALGALCGTAPAQPVAQDDGPVVVGERRGVFRWLEVPRLNAGLDLTWRSRRQTQRSPGQEEITSDEDYWRTTFNLGGQAYVGHKNLLDLTGALQLGVQETRLSSSVPDADADERLFTGLYDISGLLLQESDLPTTLYARRDETNTAREFLPSVRTTTDEYGVIGQVRSSIVPTTVRAFHREQDETDILDLGGYSLTQDSVSVQSQMRPTDRQRLEFLYAFDHIDQSQGASFRDVYDRHDGTLTHLLDFGGDDQHSLRSALRLYDQSGLFPQRQTRLDEQLLLRHAPNLETRYNLSLDDQEIRGRGQRQVLGNAQVRHQLFESLVSTASIGGSTLDVEDEFRSDTVFANGALDYTKRVPFGVLRLGVGAGVNRQDNGERGTPIPVADEVHTFNDPFPVTIARRSVEEGSLRVTSTDRLRVFVEGLDYTATFFADRAELRRVVGGAIADGQPVLVSYTIGPEPANRQDTDTYTLSFRYSIMEGWLDGLSLYTVYRRVDESIDAEDPVVFIPNDIRDLRYGADYRIGPASLLAERINHDSTISPFDSTRLQARYDQRLGPRSALSAALSRETVDYRSTTQEVTLNRATATWTQRLTPALDFTARLQYRDETDSLSGDLTGFAEALEVRWHKRQTSVRLAVENASLDGSRGDTDSLTLVFNFRREF